MFLLFILFLFTSTKSNKTIEIFIIALVLFLAVFFTTTSGFLFFLSYERMLLPIGGLILCLGIEPERIRSVIYILLYTVIASLPLLVAGIVLIKRTSSRFIGLLLRNKLNWVWLLAITFTFLVKLPVWGVHL